MRRVRLIPLLLTFLLLCGCMSVQHTGTLPLLPNMQTPEQLHLQDAPQKMLAVWIPYFTVAALLKSNDAQASADAVTDYLRRLRDCGVNTAFVHVCAFGESIYPSDYYPRQQGTENFDALRLFKDACDSLGLSFHAWLNPLRLGTTAETANRTDSSILSRQYRSRKARNSAFSECDGRLYLNPAAESTREFLRGAVIELMQNYHPDGIHIDDYFYPTDDPAWDRADFAASGAENLADWRRSNITALVKTMYAAVHEADTDAVFSISPQGNLRQNYDSLYADAAAWCRAGDCCDLLIPQLYFGYENETCPFPETAAEWAGLTETGQVKLAAGIAAYKSGQRDSLAGNGAEEWRRNPELPLRQAEEILENPAFSGAAFYHADALLALYDESDNLNFAVDNNRIHRAGL